MISFKRLSFEDKNIFDHYFSQQRYEGSECTFTNLYMWRDCFQVEWTIVDDFLCLKPTYNDKSYMLPPYGSKEGDMAKPLEKLFTYFEDRNLPFVMRGISESHKNLLEIIYPEKFVFTEERDVFDYVYLAEDLIHLKGRKYHRKRNHISNFKKNYGDYQYVPLTMDLVEPCMVQLEEWYAQRNEKDELDESLISERNAIMEALEKFGELDYTGGVILIHNKVEAFTFGDALNDDTVVIHAEKANLDIKGLYPTINQEYLQNEWPHMKYVNREEDLGLEGLQKAKLSYFPVKLVEKYKGTFKNEV